MSQVLPPDDEPLLLDELEERLERFRILYDTDSQITDEMLGQLGGKGKVEREMLRQMAATGPVRQPDRMPEAHAVAMRALEVLSRNGSRPPSTVRRLGPLTPVVRYLIQQIIHYVVRRHQRSVVVALRDLYSRRVAWVPPGSPVRSMLLRARLDVERATPAYEKNTIGIPAFLIGGAAISSVTQGVRRAAGAAAGSQVGVAVAIGVTFVLLAIASWLALQAAAVARRRIKLSLDQPLAALWETIGWCGSPPKDSSRRLAAIAVGLTFAGWLLIPVGLLLVVAVI